MVNKRELRALGFVSGFQLLHRIGPTEEDVRKYFGDKVMSYHTHNMLIRLQVQGELSKRGKRYYTTKVQRIEVFAYNRNSELLEPFDAHSEPMEERG
jgi:hypothetical protein